MAAASSSSTRGTLGDVGAAASSSSAATSGGVAASRAAGGVRGGSCCLQTFGGFVWDTQERTGIQDSARVSAIIGILQMAALQPQGYMVLIGTNACTAWFTTNVSVSFQHDGLK